MSATLWKPTASAPSPAHLRHRSLLQQQKHSHLTNWLLPTRCLGKQQLVFCSSRSGSQWRFGGPGAAQAPAPPRERKPSDSGLFQRTFAEARVAVHVPAAGQAEGRLPMRRLETEITEHPAGHGRRTTWGPRDTRDEVQTQFSAPWRRLERQLCACAHSSACVLGRDFLSKPTPSQPWSRRRLSEVASTQSTKVKKSRMLGGGSLAGQGHWFLVYHEEVGKSECLERLGGSGRREI